MNLRLISAGVFLLAGYLAFGDFLTASTLSTPEAFVSDIGRGIGGAISSLADRVELFIGW
ncbi:hypothetical protein [Boseongicola aestuarii]|uniref:Uncharacterized protein n=1 Tax=Boseongicola aestuarii TaxID=1470561 RepID=A0A238IXI5_9RHOB|nr:hypothetical protein [Boseongicola aestuarii]SMX22761.1 hypothetical protein BOA8489_00859 [Boseongicola aestuarii]